MAIPPPGSHGNCLATAVLGVSLVVGALVALGQIILQHI